MAPEEAFALLRALATDRLILEIRYVTAQTLVQLPTLKDKLHGLLLAWSHLTGNAAKHLAGIPPELELLPEGIIASLNHLKREVLKGNRLSLDLEETLIALSISAPMNPTAQAAVGIRSASKTVAK